MCLALSGYLWASGDNGSGPCAPNAFFSALRAGPTWTFESMTNSSEPLTSHLDHAHGDPGQNATAHLMAAAPDLKEGMLRSPCVESALETAAWQCIAVSRPGQLGLTILQHAPQPRRAS